MKSRNWNIIAFLGSILIFLWIAMPAHAIEVHNFDCKNCHKVGVSYTDLGNSATNVCLECHKDNPPSVTMLDGTSATPTGLFAPTDASNAMGSYPSGLSEGSGAGAQTSHMWAGRDVKEAAGAQAPSGRVFYGRYGISTGKLTCQRCHDPHSRDATNTKILRLGTNGKEQMCLDCHKPWNLDNTDHGLLTHPVVSDYQAVYDAAPDKYRSPAQVAEAQGEVTLVEGGVSCSSCHGVHFTDSDGTTVDGPAQVLSEGDGKLLRADGPEGTNLSALCQACHAYKEHGSGTETVGCLVCHSGHSYNGGTPNYYILRGQAETTTYGVVNSLSYTDLASDLGGTSSTAQLWAGSAGSADGYCERCHGELTSMPGSTRVHVEGENCNGCHGHNADGNDYAFGANCTDCHGWPPSTITAGGPDGYAFVSGSRDYSLDANYKPETTTAHLTHAGSVSGYGLACAHCHDDDFATTHNDGNFQNVFSGVSAHSVTSAGGLLSPSYDKTGDGSCSNIYCHSNGGRRNASGTKILSDYVTQTVSWANTSIISCAACHGNDTATMTSLGNSSTHTAHLDAGYACVICHEQTALDAHNLVSGSGLHVNGAADVLFANDYELSPGNVLGAGSYGTDGSCAVYCHSDGLGTTATPDWDAPASGACGTCHGNAPASGSHLRHVSDVSGPQLACSACHPANSNNAGHAAHVDGKVDVAAGVCDGCHAVDVGETIPVWGNAGTLDCLTCHGGATLSVIGGKTAPDKSLATGSGHNRPTADGPYPVSGNAAAARACLDCHDGSAPGHFDGISGNDARVIEGGAFPADYSLDKNGFCAGCHASILTHQSKDCVACHDPHGTANIEMVHRAQSVQNSKDLSGSGAFSGDVVFTARTGVDSFDELDDGAGANADDICATCHSSANGISHNNREVTGLHNAGDMRGTDCSQCHSHAKTFSPVGTACNQCHGNPPTSGAHGAHALVTLHTDAEDLSDCEACHTGAAFYSYDPAGDRTAGYNHSDSAGRKTVLAAAVGFNNATKTCATACHLSSETDGAWDDADGLACDACHYYAANPTSAGNQAYTDPLGAPLPLSSPHNAHFDAGTQCADCHGTLETQGPGLDHNNSKNAVSDADKIRYQGYEYLNPTGTAVHVDDSAYNQGGGSTWINSAVSNDGGNTCANLDCHNPSGTSYKADWDVDTASCTLCHSATDPATGAHTKHLGGRNLMYGGDVVCITCHVDNGINTAHRSGIVELSAGNKQTCHGCHYPSNMSSPGCGGCHLQSTLDQMWGLTALVSGCNSCHWQNPDFDGHPAHLSSVSGPGLGTDCSACHEANANNTSMSGQSTHLNLKVTFVNRAMPSAPYDVTMDSLHQPANDGVDTCDNCHGGPTAANLAKDAWTAGTSVSCASCHGQYGAANSAADGSGVNAPARAGSFGSVGHGRTSGEFPPAQQCANCHDSTSAHISGVLDDADRLSVSTGGYDFSVAGQKNAYCQDCHINLGGMVVHYGNTRTAGGSSTDALHCATCHDPHGQGGQDAMIRGEIGGLNVTGFTDRSARSSYYTSAIELSGGNYGVCQVCHDSVEVAYFNRTTEDDAGHNPGSACTGCHVHNSGGTAFEADCMGCHGGGLASENFGNFWPDADSKDPIHWPNRAGAHAQHVISIGDILNGGGAGSATTADKNQACIYCHPQGAHTGDQSAPPADTYRDGQAGNSDPGDYYIYLLDDPTNPGSLFPLDTQGRHEPYNYANRTNQSVSYGSCSNIDCHGNAPYTPQWYGDEVAPGAPTGLAASTHDTSGTHVDGETDDPGTVLLTWTAPGDDGYLDGTVYRYDVRWSTAPISDANFEAANHAGSPPIPQRQGRAQRMVVDGLVPGQDYYFAVRAYDEEGNQGDVAATISPVTAHEDDMKPIFWGLDRVEKTLEYNNDGTQTFSALDLSWAAAKDHTLPLDYRIWWSTYNLKTHLARGGVLPDVETSYTEDSGGGAPAVGGSDYRIHTATTTALSYRVHDLPVGVLYNFLVRAEDGSPASNREGNLVTLYGMAEAPQSLPTELRAYLADGGNTITSGGLSAQADAANLNWGGVPSTSVELMPGDSISWVAGTPYMVDTNVTGLSFEIRVENWNRDPQTLNYELGYVDGGGMWISTLGSVAAESVGMGKKARRVVRMPMSHFQGTVPAGYRLAVRVASAFGNSQNMDIRFGDSNNKGQLFVREQVYNHAPNVPGGITVTEQTNGGYLDISWSASTPNDSGQSVTYDVFGSTDGGMTFSYLIASRIEQTAVTWDTVGDGVTGGSFNCVVRVAANDGYLHETGQAYPDNYASFVLGDSSVYILDNSVDTEAPAAVTLQVAETRPKQGSVVLSWVAVGNDGYNHGTRAAQYDIRYRKTAAGLYDFASATPAEDPPVPGFSESLETYELLGLEPDQEYYVAMKVGDEAGNWSPLSNVITTQSGPKYCGICHSTPPDEPAMAGVHAAHGYTLADCAKCHGEEVLDFTIRHQDGQLKLGWGYNVTGDGSRNPTVTADILGEIVTYTQNGVIIYQDTDGAGGFNATGEYDEIAGVHGDSGTCMNFTALGNQAAGCHGPFEPRWDTGRDGVREDPHCADCHGDQSPARDLDPYGRIWDANVNDAPAPAVQAAPPVDNHGYDAGRYVGAHLVHLNSSFRFAKGDSCRMCHKDTTASGLHADGKPDVVFDIAADYDADTPAVFTPNASGPGTPGTCASLNPYGCHDTGATWTTNTTAKCNECHGFYGKNYNVAGNSSEIPHVSDGGVVRECTYCHVAGHPQSPDGISSGDPNALLINNNPAVGINYRSGGIHLRWEIGGRTMLASGDPIDTLAEICWGCHEAQSPVISEWGANTSAATGNSPYDYGYLNQSSWYGAVWSSAYGQSPGDPFYYKRGKIQSIHTTNPDGTSAVTWNADGVRYDETPDPVAKIRCSNCHDVHDSNLAPGDEMSGAPYLRGTWMGNPYEEDGAPWNKTYALPSFSPSGAASNKYGRVPRGGSAYGELGGYYIDQNNVVPGTGATTQTSAQFPTTGWTVENSAGLCVLCHGSNIDNMDQVTGENLWLGTNGHSNSAIGGSFVNAANIFDYTHGRPTPKVNTFSGKGRPESTYTNIVPDMGFVTQGAESLAGGGYRGVDSNSGGYLPRMTEEYAYGYNDYDWGTSVDGTSVDIMYHQFSCSKCHNPHASRLPKLMITNCLDIRHNTWDDAQSSLQTKYTDASLDNVDRNKKAAYYAAAQNCHRYDDSRSTQQLRGGWNKVTPWVKDNLNEVVNP